MDELEAASEDVVGSLHVAFPEVGQAGIEHLGDRGEVLDGPVVEELRQAAPFLLLGQNPLGE